MAAQADTYAPTAASQDFAGGTGGWTQTTGASGSCVPTLLCPTVTNDWTAGGADGNGYIRTTLGSTLATLNGTSTGVWASPAFTYNGNGGVVPATATFDLSMRSDIADLLGASQLNDSSYRVDLVDAATGNQVSLVPATVLRADTSWTAIQTASVNPALLALGHNYKIQISTSYHSAGAVNATGEVGYDNGRLKTVGVGANSGSGITSAAQLSALTSSYILPDSAKLLIGSTKLVGNKLKIKLRCPAIASPKACRIKITGLAKGKHSKAATASKVVKVKPGRAKVVKLRVKPKYLARYKVAKKIWLKSVVRVGVIKVKVRKRVKLKH